MPVDEQPVRRPRSASREADRALVHVAFKVDSRRIHAELVLLKGVGFGFAAGIAVVLTLALFRTINPLLAAEILAFMCVSGFFVARAMPHRARPSYDSLEDRLARLEALEDQEYRAVERNAEVKRRNGVEEREVLSAVTSECDRIYHRSAARIRAVYEGAVSAEPDMMIELPEASLSSLSRTTAPAIPSGIMPPSTMVHPAIPERLLAGKKAGHVIPFVGAGLSMGSDIKGGFPAWRDLPGRLLQQCEYYHVWFNDHERRAVRDRFFESDPAALNGERAVAMALSDLLLALDVLKQKLGVHYGAALRAIFCPADAAPGAGHQAILALGAQVVCTTNYDRLLELSEPDRQMWVGKKASAALAVLGEHRKLLFKVHGSAEDEDSVVLTLGEYSTAHQDPAYRKVLSHLLIENSLLFVGYGMVDPHDLDIILSENVTHLPGATALHFALLQRLPDRHAEVERQARLRKDHGVMVIAYDNHSEIVPFLWALARA